MTTPTGTYAIGLPYVRAVVSQGTPPEEGVSLVFYTVEGPAAAQIRLTYAELDKLVLMLGSLAQQRTPALVKLSA